MPTYENQLKSVAGNAIIENMNDGEVNGHQAKFLDMRVEQQNIKFKAFVALIKGDNNDI